MKDGEVKYMDIEEFRSEGYLQETNRKFLHPLGLALEVKYDDDGNAILGGIWDFRDDPEGMKYDIANRNNKQQQEMKNKALHVQNKILEKAEKRINMFGGVIVEPIPGFNG